jgi:hypothetical protein
MPISEELLSSIENDSMSINLCSHYPMITDKDIKRLVAAVKVKNDTLDLMLNDNGVSDEGVQAITELNKLEALSLSSNQITDSGAKSIAQMKSLISLDIAENEITDDGMSEIVSSLPKLKSLTLTSEAVGDKTVEAILNHPKLEEVLIYDDENVESEVIDQISMHTENNKKKNEAGKTIIDKKQLEQLADQLKSANISKKQTFFTPQEPAKARENTKTKQENLLKQALEILKSISDPQEQEFFKEDLINSIRRLNPLNNSPECKS